jgi:ribosome biogenesis protein SSF1/2
VRSCVFAAQQCCVLIRLRRRVARLPRGPTLTFRVHGYSLARDVHNAQRHPKSLITSLFRNAPLVRLAGHCKRDQACLHAMAQLILNNMARDGLHFKLMTTMFQNMFPSINIDTVCVCVMVCVCLCDGVCVCV